MTRLFVAWLNLFFVRYSTQLLNVLRFGLLGELGSAQIVPPSTYRWGVRAFIISLKDNSLCRVFVP